MPLDLGFIATVVLVSSSGVLSPGPLTFYTLGEGMRNGYRSGLHISTGHMLFEFPYVLALAAGFGSFLAQPVARMIAGLVGGSVLIIFAVLQALSALKLGTEKPKERRVFRSALVMGVVLTALNPFFLLWWVTVGSKLVLDALVLASASGLLVMYLSHIWMDYVFLGLASYLAHRGVNLLGSKPYRAILVAFSIILAYFGAVFITSST